MAREVVPAEDETFFGQACAQIQEAQIQAILSVSRELTLLYWRIGREISERMQTQGWGAKVVDRLASDSRRDFPEMKGIS